MNKEVLVKQIQSGSHKAIEDIYIRYKTEFLVYAARFAISDEDALDIYQDSVIVLYENILSGKLVSFSSSIKTYLFAIGKYKIYNKSKSKIATESFSDFQFILEEESEGELPVQEENIKKLLSIYKELGSKCKEVLKLFYYENKTIEDIKNQLGYTSKDVVKSQKSRCLKQLKELMLKENK